MKYLSEDERRELYPEPSYQDQMQSLSKERDARLFGPRGDADTLASAVRQGEHVAELKALRDLANILQYAPHQEACRCRSCKRKPETAEVRDHWAARVVDLRSQIRSSVLPHADALIVNPDCRKAVCDFAFVARDACDKVPHLFRSTVEDAHDRAIVIHAAGFPWIRYWNVSSVSWGGTTYDIGNAPSKKEDR